jgi:hypothetical protein
MKETVNCKLSTVDTRRRFLQRCSIALILLIGVTWVGLDACKKSPAPIRTEPRSVASGYELKLDALGEDRLAALRALRMPHHAIATRLGAHVVKSKSTLVTELKGSPSKRLDQEVTLRMNGKGEFAALKTTTAPYGAEVIWTQDWLYPRLRTSKFLKRRARGAEPVEIADRMYGLLPAYIRLLSRFIDIESAGKTQLMGREVIRVKLKLKAEIAPPAQPTGLARQWRQSVSAKSIEGQSLLDVKTGAPLSMDLRARWSFNPPATQSPATTGIPGTIQRNALGTMELTYSQRITDIGKSARIDPPPEGDTIDNPRRIRLEIERQMLTGELPIAESTRSEP